MPFNWALYAKMRLNRDQLVCEWQGVKPDLPELGSKVGLAVETLKDKPLHAVRHKAENGTNGWYIWCGEYSEDPDFFSPLHVEHLEKYIPEFIQYIGLPSGYRVLIDGEGYEDVWFDENV